MKKKSRIRRLLKYIIFFIIVAASLYGLNVFFSSRTRATYTPPLTPVTVTRAEKGNIEKGITFSSYIEASAMIPVVPFVSGTIEEYMIEAGDRVEKDQVLAVIDREAFYQQMLQARAQYLAYESAYGRVKELSALGAATAQDLDTVTAQRDAAAAQLELANLQLSYTEVKAPVAGTVLQAPQSKGDIASDRAPVAVIADLDDLVVNVSVPEKYYTVLNERKDNLIFTVTRDGDGASSPATLVSIAPFIDAATKTFKVKVRVDDPSLFTPGMYVKTEIIYERAEDITILSQSLRKSDGSLYALEDGKAKYVEFTPEIENDLYFQVPAGYEDALIIDEGHNGVLDGEEVRVMEK